MPNKVTIKEIAAKAGVSEATVSRVLNSKNWVKPETREKIAAAIRELNYEPSGLAQNLGRGQSKTGIIGTMIASPYQSIFNDHVFSQIINGIGEIVAERGDSLLLSPVNDQYQNENDLPSMVTRRLIDGLIIGGIPIQERFIKDLIKRGLPLVVIGKYEICPTHRILVDNIGGGRKATEHLIKLGHQRIGLIHGAKEIYAFADKVKGYHEALNNYGIPSQPELIVEELGESRQAGYKAMEKLMGLKKPPTAVFITDMTMTLGALWYLANRRIAIPDSVAIVSYCSGNPGDLSQIPLTFVQIGERNIGHAAARLLFDIIDERITGPMDVTISTELVIGESCGFKKRQVLMGGESGSSTVPENR